jgi:hypothetical protein
VTKELQMQQRSLVSSCIFMVSVSPHLEVYCNCFWDADATFEIQLSLKQGKRVFLTRSTSYYKVMQIC